MRQVDGESILQRAREKYPNARPTWNVGDFLGVKFGKENERDRSR